MFFKKRFENAIKAHKSETIVLQNTVNEAIKNEESINQLRLLISVENCKYYHGFDKSRL